ncbi:MAG: hypothetical protein V1709_10805 [Planctomycetota bacterium]
MNKLILGMILIIPVFLSGCALGAATSATAGYALQSKFSDELGNTARQSIIDEAVKKSKDYTDNRLGSK